jgi:VWFA-related protein
MRTGRSILAPVTLFLASFPAAAQFMRGKVTMPDGSAPAGKAVIERVCPTGKPVQETVSNKFGEFVWRINNDTVAYKSLTIGSHTRLRCGLRARLGNLVSALVDIDDPVVLNRPELPAMRLRPAERDSAPELPKLSKATLKLWDLGAKAVAAGQWPDAERHLREVARASPNFALAWSGLGYALQSQQKTAEAREAYRKAIAVDPAALLPRVQLLRMEVAAKLWNEASASAAAVIAADKENRYPEVHFHHGMARYMLKDFDGARPPLEEAVRRDTRREMPQAEYLLGAVLSAKGDRAGAALHLARYLELAPGASNATFVRDQITRLSRPDLPAAPEPLLPVPDEIIPADTEPVVTVVGEARVPGGRKALAAAARLAETPEPSRFFAEYCRAVAEETSPLTERHIPGYNATLEAFLESATELSAMGEIELSLAPDALTRTERALSLLGWRVSGREIEPGDRAADGPRRRAMRALGIDEGAMRDAVNSGRPFRIQVLTENVPLVGGSAWGALLTGFSSLPGGVAQGFLRQPRLARACSALSRLEPSTAIAFARRVGLRSLVNLHGDALWMYREALRTPVAGAEVWSKLAGAHPRDPAAFFEALLRADRGRLLPFYAAVVRGDAAHQSWVTRDIARAQRLYGWFRDAPPGSPAWRAAVFADLPLDEAGNVRYPGGRSAWTDAVSDDDAIAPSERIGNMRLIRSLPPVDLEALVAISRLERERGRPLDSRSARLLASHFAEWRDLFPHFLELPALNETGFEALATFAAASASLGPTAQSHVSAQWHSLIALVVLARRAGTIDDAAAAQAFAEVSRTLAQPRPESLALQWLHGFAGPDLDEGVARLLALSGVARDAFEHIRDAQDAPRLGKLRSPPDPAELAMALAGVVYGALLKPDGLLVNEDRRLLAKHVWTPRFAASSFAPSNTGDGSHFSGGFAGFAELARVLTAGGAVSIRHDNASAASADVPSEALFRADARLVEVHTTVMDERGRYLDGLAMERFSVRENGLPVSLVSFEPATAPISCSLLLDTSESMDAALPALKSAATKLIGALRTGDPVAIYTLGDSVREVQAFTNDHLAAARAVQRAEPGGETALYDAMTRVNRDLAGRTGKKVIIVFTDGQDNASTLTSAAAILRARTAGIPIYTVAQGHALNHPALLAELAGMSRATGGLSFTIAAPEEAAGVFQRIVQDLLHGYLLAFSPPAVEDRSWRRIEVQVRANPGHTVRAREGYYPR